MQWLRRLTVAGGIAVALAEPLYRVIAEPFAKSLGEHLNQFMSHFFKP